MVQRMASVTSTQDVLRRLLEAGESVAGLAVRAGQQTSGRGRRGNAWRSQVGGSYQSVGITWPVAPIGAGVAPLSLLPVALAVGIATELSSSGAKALVKWPNDLVLGGRKLGGILVEMISGTAVAGIGINVANPVPPGFAALGGWETEVVSDMVLAGVASGVALMASGPDAVVRAFEAVDWLLGKAVLMDGSHTASRADGIDAAGCLRLVDVRGEVSRVCSGHVLSVDGAAWAQPA